MTARGFRFGQAVTRPSAPPAPSTPRGKYDFVLEYTADLSGLPPPPDAATTPPPTSDPGSDLPSALEKQLGLKLTRRKAKLDVIVVDHVERNPTEN